MKRPDWPLILSIFAACVIVSGAIVYKTWPQEPPPALVVAQVAVPAPIQACRTGDSCIVVETGCTVSCAWATINSRSLPLFKQILGLACGAAHPQTCVSPLPATTCLQGRCQLVKR